MEEGYVESEQHVGYL